MVKKLTSKRLTGKSRPSTKSKFKPISGSKRHSKNQSKKTHDKASAKRALSKRASIHKPIKSTNNIHEAVKFSKDRFKRRFLGENVDIRGDRHKGWNFRTKNYYFGGTALIYVSVNSSSPFPVDNSAMDTNHFKSTVVKTSNRDGFIKDEGAFYEALFTKRLHKNLGKMNFEQAKLVYEKELAHEDSRFISMLNQFRADNRDVGSIEKVKWFKLIAN
jgi:hypothetical protein